MASEIKANKISPATGTAFTIGDSGDTFTVPSGATLAVASGATISNAGTSSGFGKVLQVVSDSHSTQESTSSTTFVATSLTASITPSSTSNKILVMFQNCFYVNSPQYRGGATVYRDATNLSSATGFGVIRGGSTSGGDDAAGNLGAIFLDSPATTSATTYTVYIKSFDSGVNFYSNYAGATGTITLMEIEG